jgi:hypothetical protein
MLKRYIVRKYIMARSVVDALQFEVDRKPDDCWVDDEWKKDNPTELVSAIGFRLPSNPDYSNIDC